MAAIHGLGCYVPERVMSNDDWSALLDTSDEWITSRTGIKERRVAADDEFTSDLGTKAALAAMAKADISADQIDLIIVATITPDMTFPSTAALIQAKIGAGRAAGHRRGARDLRPEARRSRRRGGCRDRVPLLGGR